VVIRFNEQALIGFRVYGPGEMVELPDETVAQLIRDGVAVEVEPIREATSPVVKHARRATKRGGGREIGSP